MTERQRPKRLPPSSQRMKEPKTIEDHEEAEMQAYAKLCIEDMAKDWPHAREIDLLNACLRVFTERLAVEETPE